MRGGESVQQEEGRHQQHQAFTGISVRCAANKGTVV